MTIRWLRRSQLRFDEVRVENLFKPHLCHVKYTCQKGAQREHSSNCLKTRRFDEVRVENLFKPHLCHVK
jgi:hypothetical protein